jgi:ribosomal protein S18 acetylase RimI-like enzyme
MKVKYTVADYRRIHQGIIEDMIDTCISKWHDQAHDPLEARVYRNLAYALEDLRNAEDCLLKGANLSVWVSAANAEANNKTKEKAQ